MPKQHCVLREGCIDASPMESGYVRISAASVLCVDLHARMYFVKSLAPSKVRKPT